MCHFLELRGKIQQNYFLTKGEVVNYLHGALNSGIIYVQGKKKNLRGLEIHAAFSLVYNW